MGVKHKTFISFYHEDDQYYKEKLEKLWGHQIINKSVEYGEYDSDDTDAYIKRLIREEKISDSSVVVVLVGPNTKNRKHVDWEIYAGLRNSINGSAGLVGILLPEVLTPDRKYYKSDLPLRLADNVESGYAKVYAWDYAIENFTEIVEEAFENRIRLKEYKRNNRVQMKINKHN